MRLLIPVLLLLVVLAYVIRRLMRRPNLAGVSKIDFTLARFAWMNRFVSSLDPAFPATMRTPVELPIKGGVEYVATRTFDGVEGTIFYREPSGACDILLKKFRQEACGSGEIEWEGLWTYRPATIPSRMARVIIGSLTGKLPIDRVMEAFASAAPAPPPIPRIDPFDPVPSDPPAQA